MKMGMTVDSASQCMASFRVLVRLFLARLDVSEVHSSQVSHLFIFDFRHMFQVDPYLLIFFFPSPLFL